MKSGNIFMKKGSGSRQFSGMKMRCMQKDARSRGVCAGGMLWISALYSALCLLWQAGGREDAKMYNEMAGVFRPEDASVRQNREYLAKRA